MKRRDIVLSCWFLSAAHCAQPAKTASPVTSAADGGARVDAGASGVNVAPSAAGGGGAGAPVRVSAGGAGAAAPPLTTSAAGSGGGAGAVGLAAVGGAGGAPASAQAARNEWRMMGYDERNWYLNPVETEISVQNAGQLREQWRFKVSGFPVGSPVIADGKVFALASGGMYAIDLSSGKEIWHRDDLLGSAAVAYDAGFIYVQNSAPAGLYKLKASDGSTVWGPLKNCLTDNGCTGEASPIVIGDTVLIGMENNVAEASTDPAQVANVRGAVSAFDTMSGMLRWRYFTIPMDNPSGENGASVWSTVSVDRATQTVFATTGNNFSVSGPNGEAFHAIDFASGSKRWVSQVRKGDTWSTGNNDDQKDMDFGANPILAELDGRHLVAAGDKGGAFWALDRDTGEILWSRDKLSPSHSASNGGVFINGAFDGRAFYVVANDPARGGAMLHRLDAAKQGESTWTHSFDETMWGASSLANGVLFVPINATLYVMNADTGEMLASFDTGGTIAGGSPAVAEGRVVVKSGLLWGDLLASRANDEVICYALPSAPPVSGQGAAGAGGSSAPSNDASFTAIYRDLIAAQGCTSGRCHSNAASGALNLMSKELAYTNLVGARAAGPDCASSSLLRVAPNDPDHSLLVQKLEHTQSCGAPMPSPTLMPPTGALRRWIMRGAPND